MDFDLAFLGLRLAFDLYGA